MKNKENNFKRLKIKYIYFIIFKCKINIWKIKGIYSKLYKWFIGYSLVVFVFNVWKLCFLLKIKIIIVIYWKLENVYWILFLYIFLSKVLKEEI